MTLTVDYCSHQAASYAVLHWHYSRRMPVGRLVTVGAWEDGAFVGAVVFGRGASPNLGKPFGYRQQTEACELVRIALREHDAPVSQITTRAVDLLREKSPGMRLVISFADPSQGHLGRIYQAMNWIYTGMTSGGQVKYYFEGRWHHNRSARLPMSAQVVEQGTNGFFGGSRLYQAIQAGHVKLEELPRKTDPGKFRYVYPLDRQARRRVQRLALPYPQTLPADQVSEARRRPPGSEVEVRSLGSAPTP